MTIFEIYVGLRVYDLNRKPCIVGIISYINKVSNHMEIKFEKGQGIYGEAEKYFNIENYVDNIIDENTYIKFIKK